MMTEGWVGIGLGSPRLRFGLSSGGGCGLWAARWAAPSAGVEGEEQMCGRGRGAQRRAGGGQWADTLGCNLHGCLRCLGTDNHVINNFWVVLAKHNSY